MNNFITELKENEVFVYGSNRKGIHGSGAAKYARDNFGAVYGIGEGLVGQSYGIPTKETPYKTLSLAEIAEHVDKFISFAIANRDFIFLVTEIGCGLAGYKVEQIAPLFKSALTVKNIVLPIKFLEVLRYAC